MRRGTPPTIAVAINDITTCAWLVYDALGRRVEQPGPQIVYGIDGGKLALMNHQTVSKAFAPLPAGAAAVYTGSTLAWYRHPDWLGSSWITSLASGTDRRSRDVSYSPFGDSASESGPGTADRNFTGQNQDLTGILYDFPAREYSQGEGRWISPDPAGIAAVDPANPQSWNRYGYVNNNPLSLIDPTGMETSPSLIEYVSRVVEKDGCLYLQMGTRTQYVDTVLDQKVYTYAWGGMSLLRCMTSGTGPHGPGGGGDGGNGKGTLRKAYCRAIPSGRVMSLNGALGGLGAVGVEGDMVLNYNSGQTSLFATGGMSLGWNGGASATASTGLVYGLDGTNNGFAGPFKGGSFYFPTPIPGVGAGGSVTHSGSVTVYSVGASAALAGRYAGGASVTTTSRPLNIGKFAGFSLNDFLTYLLRRPCN